MSTSVINHTIIIKPSIQQQGFDLPYHAWYLLNCFCTDQGPCLANRHRWPARSAVCESIRCGLNHSQHMTVNNFSVVCNHSTKWKMMYTPGWKLRHTQNALNCRVSIQCKGNYKLQVLMHLPLPYEMGVKTSISKHVLKIAMFIKQQLNSSVFNHPHKEIHCVGSL